MKIVREPFFTKNTRTSENLFNQQSPLSPSPSPVAKFILHDTFNVIKLIIICSRQKYKIKNNRRNKQPHNNGFVTSCVWLKMITKCQPDECTMHTTAHLLYPTRSAFENSEIQAMEGPLFHTF